MSTRVEVYDTEYEAYFNLIAVQGPEHQVHGRPTYVSVAWCLDETCVDEDDVEWSASRHRLEDARLAGLAHCREKHVRGPWR